MKFDNFAGPSLTWLEVLKSGIWCFTGCIITVACYLSNKAKFYEAE